MLIIIHRVFGAWSRTHSILLNSLLQLSLDLAGAPSLQSVLRLENQLMVEFLPSSERTNMAQETSSVAFVLTSIFVLLAR